MDEAKPMMTAMIVSRTASTKRARAIAGIITIRARMSSRNRTNANSPRMFNVASLSSVDRMPYDMIGRFYDLCERTETNSLVANARRFGPCPLLSR